MDLRQLLKDTLEMFRPPRDETVSEWADENRVLVSESSAEPGRWRTDRAPYQKDIMDAFTQPGIWEIAVMTSAQVGKTELALNMMGRAIDDDPGPMLFVQPTVDFAEDFSKRRIAPMIRACPTLNRKVYKATSRDSSNTLTMKSFPGGSISFVGANSPTELAGRPIRYLFMDEIDRFPVSAGTEGDPLELAEKRTETFRHNRKIVYTSTPTIKNASKIERKFLEGTQEEWQVQCPHCGHYSYITFNNIKFEKDTTDENGKKGYRVTRVDWQCPACRELTNEFDTKRQPAKWVMMNPEAEDRGIRSFKMNAFVSPWSDWKDIVYKFLRAKDDPELLKTFHNTILGESWEIMDRSGVSDELYERREHYAAEVPDGVLVLTMGVDTQDNRLEYEVVGWDRNEQSWGIQYGIIPGRADEPAVWEEIDGLLDREFKMRNGATLQISAAFVDSGGHHTQEVYKQCDKRNARHVYAIKGDHGEGIPYVRLMKSSGRSGGVRFLIGVDSGKEGIMYAVNMQEPGPKYCHFPKDHRTGYDTEYFRGLISEKQVFHTKRGQQTVAWVKTYERNEPLDIRNYNRACYKFFHWQFDKIENALNGIDTPAPAKDNKPKKQRRVISKGIQV